MTGLKCLLAVINLFFCMTHISKGTKFHTLAFQLNRFSVYISYQSWNLGISFDFLNLVLILATRSLIKWWIKFILAGFDSLKLINVVTVFEHLEWTFRKGSR